MNEEFTISRLAKAAQIPTTTVRYYERIGLLEPDNRSQGNYRLYSIETLHKLKFIRAAQAIGFTLTDVRALLGAGDDHPNCGQVQTLIQDRVTDIDRRMRDLRHVQRVLKDALATCQKSAPTDTCQVLVNLGHQ